MMKSIICLTLLGYVYGELESIRWAKDAGHAPVFNQENDGTVTAEWPIFEGKMEDVQELKRRMADTYTDTEWAQLMLDYHNELRSTTALGLAPCTCGSDCGKSPGGSGKHPGARDMNSMFWDDALARVAQQYADKCVFEHNSARSAETNAFRDTAVWKQTKQYYVGENLYISSTGEEKWTSVSSWDGKDYGIKGGFYGWWIECEDYRYPEHTSCGSQIGHYTQYVQASSRFVGCGVTICNGVPGYDWVRLNVVCNYGGGQYSGRLPYTAAYTTSQIATECDPDRQPNLKTGLCEGPQAIDYFENAQTSYDLTSQTEASGLWICHDGTVYENGKVVGGRDVGCGVSEITPKPTPYPTTSSSPTPSPTNKPITPQPTTLEPTKGPSKDPTTPEPTTPEPTVDNSTPTDPPTDKPTTPEPTTQKPTPQPVNVVTSLPTRPTPKPVTPSPIKETTNPPTGRPTTTSTTTEPDGTTTTSSACDISKCEFDTDISWESETWTYRGLTTSAWNAQKRLMRLENSRSGYSSGSSLSGYYQYSDTIRNWILYITDKIDLNFDEIDCSEKLGYIEILTSDAFKASMIEAIEEDMGTSAGKVTGIEVTISCGESGGAAFGAIDDDGNVELPFSTWNLNTYDFSDWFVLLFILFTGCACCFGCGWAMHRRRVFKAMDNASISDFGDQPMVTMDGNQSPIGQTSNIQPVNDDYHNTNDNEPEIEIGVSVNSNRNGIMPEDSD